MFSRDGLNVHFLMLLVAIIWGGSWAIGRMLALSLPPATGAWMRYVVCMLAFYLWFFYRSVRGEKLLWLPDSRAVSYTHLTLPTILLV